MTRRISSDRNYFFDSPMIRDLPPNSQRTTTPVKMIFQLTDFILPSKSLLENSSQINTVLAFLKVIIIASRVKVPTCHTISH